MCWPVLSLHKQIDAAVTDPHGWIYDLPDSELLNRLVRLNHEWAAEETVGNIRYLRPSYQAPGQQQLGIDLPTSATAVGFPFAAASQSAGMAEGVGPTNAGRTRRCSAGGRYYQCQQVAALFLRTNAGKVYPLLDTLATLALIRQTPEGAYAV